MADLYAEWQPRLEKVGYNPKEPLVVALMKNHYSISDPLDKEALRAYIDLCKRWGIVVPEDYR